MNVSSAVDEQITDWPRHGQVVIFDLEWTAWEGSLARAWTGPGESRELIQIGAIRVDALDFQELESFECLVKPVKNPCLSAYIERLTGLSSERVACEGLDLMLALERLKGFARSDKLLCNGGDALVLRENCLLQGFQCPTPFEDVEDIRPLLCRLTGRTAAELVSSRLPVLLGIGIEEHAHNGLADARAIARALAHLLRNRLSSS